jgi:phospholipid/cholesterol/gamma-HCH transport system substrate-binding protein
VRVAIRKYWLEFVAVLALIALALGIGGYLLSQQRLRFPLLDEEPKRLAVELSDAQAVQPGQGQSVRVAGIQVGQISDVQVEDGVAVVEVEIEKEYDDLIRRDATALLRPKTALKDMFLEVDPGTGEVLPEDGRIPVANTLPDVDPDEIYSALDGDTRPYLKLLVAGAGKGLRGRGEDLAATLRRLEPVHRDLARVTRATASRRQALKRLIHNYSLLIGELGRRPGDLRRLVSASRAVFDALAGEEANIEESVALLPGALEASARTLGKVETFAEVARPALESLRPVVRELPATNAAVTPFLEDTEPVIKNELRPFARIAQPWTDDLRLAARGTAKAAPDLTTSLAELNRFVNMGAFNPGGAQGLGGLSIPQQRARQEGFLYWLAWTAQNGVSLFSSADGQGPWRRVTLCGVPGPVVAGLLQSVLTEVGATEPEFVEELIGGPLSGGVQPGSPVQALLDTQFGGCSFDSLPTTPFSPPLPGGLPDLLPVSTLPGGGP